jgi:ammonia channel protein AmtB
VVNHFDPVRVSDEVESKGLDQTIHGEMAYDFED